MNLGIYDPDTANRRPWSEFIGNGHDFYDLEGLYLGERQADLIFAHGSYLQQELFNTFRETSPEVPLVVISSGLPHDWWKDDDYSYWRKAGVDKPGLHFSNCCRTFLRRLSQDVVLEFGLLEPSGEVELAFHLLCEAKQACGGEAKREDYNGTGITIHAPQSIWKWLKPFDIPEPQDEPTKADAQTIEKVAAMMGSDFKDKAQAVLQAVNDEKDPSSAIRAFLGEPESAPTNP